MKSLLRGLCSRLGFRISRESSDPLVRMMDWAREIIRLQPRDFPRLQKEISEIAFAAALRQAIALLKPDLVVDVGANRGQFASLVRRLGCSAPIVSIEPQRHLADALCEHARATDPHWRVLHGAAGERDETMVLNTYADDTFSSLHHVNRKAVERFGSLLASAASETVRVRRLDDLLRDHHIEGTRILLKTDTQGHDLAVLRGAEKLLGTSVIVIAEVSHVPLYDSAVSLEDLGGLLSPTHCLAGCYPVSSAQDLAVLESDCLFVSRSS